VRLLVTGAAGQVGWELGRSLAPLGEVIALSREQCDLSKPQNLPGIVASAKPDVVINAAAYTAVDRAEQEEALATQINGEAVGVLAEATRGLGALFLHYSTDYVFDGTKGSPYTEDDHPHPINAYGRSKLAGERAVAQCGGRYLILRTSWVYAARGRNFLRTVLRLAGERDELRMVDDQVGAPTWARDIADATAAIIGRVRDADDAFAPGIFNLTASGATSWCGFARAILDEAEKRPGLLRQRPRLQPIASADYPVPAARPMNSRLSGTQLRESFGIALPDWRQSLSQCMLDPALALALVPGA